MINEFDFKIRYIKGKDKRVAHALSRRVQVHHLEAMSSYTMDLQDRILLASPQDVKYMEIVHKLQQGVDTSTSTGLGTCSGTGIGIGAQGMDYFLTMDRLIRF